MCVHEGIYLCVSVVGVGEAVCGVLRCDVSVYGAYMHAYEE